MAPIVDLTQKIVLGITTQNVLDWLYLLFTILIFIIGFYVYFKAEGDRKILLIALGFLFFFIAGWANITDLFDKDLLTPWATVFNFLGALCVLIAVEPLNAIKHYQKSRV